MRPAILHTSGLVRGPTSLRPQPEAPLVYDWTGRTPIRNSDLNLVAGKTMLVFP